MSNIPRTLGRYEVAGFLASGGMAEVFLGRVHGPSGFDRPVVLKRILPHLARQSSFVDMFLDEARIVARMRHPSVVHVHELAMEGGELFMVMEYLEGESVAGLVRRLIARGETLDPTLAAYLVAEACAGLHAAHELCDDDGRSLGVVHRDVSPQNLFVTFAGGVKLLDFGIAKAQDRVTRTETGQLKGKLEYMSPEQCQTKDLDRRSDVFSLGVVLYELLTLRRLFKRATPLATLKAITEEPLLPPSRLSASCPRELDAICLRALERDPAARYATAAELRRDLVVAMQSTVSDALPEEGLRTLMLRLFSDRKQEKDEMLRRVREGSNPTALPAPEVDDSVEVPVVFAEGNTVAGGNTVVDLPASLPSPEHTARAKQTPGRRGLVVALLAVALSIVLVGAVATLLSGRREEAKNAPAPVESVAPAAAQAEPSAEATALPPTQRLVQVSIESDPAGASVVIDGEPRGPTPVVVSLPASDRRIAVELTKQGFAAVRDTIALDADQRLKLTLLPVRAQRPSARPSSPSTASRTTERPNDPLQTKW